MRTSKDDLRPLRCDRYKEPLERFEEVLLPKGQVFLLGAGCSKCAGLPIASELTDSVLRSKSLSDTGRSILEGIKSSFNGSQISHIEDYLSELVDLVAIAERRLDRNAMQHEVAIGARTYSAEDLRNTVEEVEAAIAKDIGRQVLISTHREFIEYMHKGVRIGREDDDPTIDYLVLNYDTLMEDALALERVVFADGMEGGVTGWWNPDNFDRPSLAARVLKLHGSVDWCEVAGDSLPRRLSSNIETNEDQSNRVLIWPAATKYRATQQDPFAQLTERARKYLRPQRDQQRVLVICGYSFNDSHINLEIEEAMYKSSGNLTVVALSSDDNPKGILKTWYESSDIRNQVLIYARRGFFHDQSAIRSDSDLPWWKFENIVRILRGER